MGESYEAFLYHARVSSPSPYVDGNGPFDESRLKPHNFDFDIQNRVSDGLLFVRRLEKRQSK